MLVCVGWNALAPVETTVSVCRLLSGMMGLSIHSKLLYHLPPWVIYALALRSEAVPVLLPELRILCACHRQSSHTETARRVYLWFCALRILCCSMQQQQQPCGLCL